MTAETRSRTWWSSRKASHSMDRTGVADPLARRFAGLDSAPGRDGRTWRVSNFLRQARHRHHPYRFSACVGAKAGHAAHRTGEENAQCYTRRNPPRPPIAARRNTCGKRRGRGLCTRSLVGNNVSRRSHRNERRRHVRHYKYPRRKNLVRVSEDGVSCRPRLSWRRRTI